MLSVRFYRFSLSIVASAPGISGHLLIPIKKHKHTESPAKPTPPPGRTSSTTTATGSNSRRLTHRRIPLRLQGDSPARIFSFAEDFPVEKVLQEDEGIGDWRLVLRSQLKEGVFIDVTMDFGLADDGESGSNKTAEGGEQAGGGGEEDAGERFLRGGTVIHLMDGAVYTGVIHRPHGTSGQDQKTGADRFYFYFSVDYAILDGEGGPLRTLGKSADVLTARSRSSVLEKVALSVIQGTEECSLETKCASFFLLLTLVLQLSSTSEASFYKVDVLVFFLACSRDWSAGEEDINQLTLLMLSRRYRYACMYIYICVYAYVFVYVPIRISIYGRRTHLYTPIFCLFIPLRYSREEGGS